MGKILLLLLLAVLLSSALFVTNPGYTKLIDKKTPVNKKGGLMQVIGYDDVISSEYTSYFE